MAAKTITVVDGGVRGGVQVNPRPSDKGVRFEVPFAKALKAAQDSGVDVYVKNLKAGKRISMKPNNKCFVPFLRTFKAQDTPQVEQPKAESKPAPRKSRKGSTPRKSLEDRIVAARKAGDMELLTKLVDQKFGL